MTAFGTQVPFDLSDYERLQGNLGWTDEILK